MGEQSYYSQAVENMERTLRDVSRLMGWDDDPDAQAATCADMGYDVPDDGDAADAASDALAEWPLGVERHEVWTIMLGSGGPTVYVEIDVRDGEVIGGRYVTTAPGYVESAGVQTVALTEKQADTFASAFLPDLTA